VGTAPSSAWIRTTSSFAPGDGATGPGSRWQAASDANRTREIAASFFTVPNIAASRLKARTVYQRGRPGNRAYPGAMKAVRWAALAVIFGGAGVFVWWSMRTYDCKKLEDRLCVFAADSCDNIKKSFKFGKPTP